MTAHILQWKPRPLPTPKPEYQTMHFDASRISVCDIAAALGQHGLALRGVGGPLEIIRAERRDG